MDTHHATYCARTLRAVADRIIENPSHDQNAAWTYGKVRRCVLTFLVTEHTLPVEAAQVLLDAMEYAEAAAIGGQDAQLHYVETAVCLRKVADMINPEPARV